jgi:hypothetical protein
MSNKRILVNAKRWAEERTGAADAFACVPPERSPAALHWFEESVQRAGSISESPDWAG